MSRQRSHPDALLARAKALDWRWYGLAVGVVGVCTGAAWLMFPYFSSSNLIMIYLLGVVAMAARATRGPTVLASVLSVAAFNFFFVPPRLSFGVSDTEHLLTFAIMLLVALVISGLTVRIRVQAETARSRERRIAALYGMSRELAGARDVDRLLEAAVRHTGEVFPGHVTILLAGEGGRVEPRRWAPEGATLDSAERAVAQWAFEHREPAGLGTGTPPGARALYLPLVGSRGAVGVLGIVPAEPRALQIPETRHQLETFANQTALAIERALLADEARDAEVRAETERLRNSLLSSVSHDLRTPLATIIGASSGLLDNGDRLDPATRRELIRSIHGEADHLERLVNSLLEMTRLDSGTIKIKREPQALDGVMGAALRRLEAMLRDRPVRVALPADLPLVPMDALLLQQVFLNLLDNAVRYSPPDTPLEISTLAAGLTLVVEVNDRGPGFAPGDEWRAFEKFYRGRASGARGVGLGLSICRAIIEAHGGTIAAENRSGGGATLRFTLPLDDAPAGLPPADE